MRRGDWGSGEAKGKREPGRPGTWRMPFTEFVIGQRRTVAVDESSCDPAGGLELDDVLGGRRVSDDRAGRQITLAR